MRSREVSTESVAFMPRLTLGRSITVGHQAVELLMRRAQIQGISGRPKFRRVAGVAAAEDRVARQFHRDQADELCVTDETEHPTREGKVYCAVVLDAWSRRRHNQKAPVPVGLPRP